MKTEVSHIRLDNGKEMRVLEEEREGSIIFVRPLNKDEIDTGETVKFDPENEKIIVTQPVYCICIHTTEEVGRKDDILIWVRVIPDGRDGSTVYGRTLLPNEVDTGLTIQLRSGDNFVMRPGSLTLSVDSIDTCVTTKFEDGYLSITNTVWTSFCVFPNSTTLPGEVPRFLLSTARRLDACHEMFLLLHSKLKKLETVEYGVHQRNLTVEIIGLVEVAIVAMSRSLQMSLKLHDHFSITTCFPESVKNKLAALKQMRNAYEHIEDRSLGLVNGKPNIDALSIFDFEHLFKKGVATYGNYKLDIHDEAIKLLIDTRQYLKEATSELIFQDRS